MFVSSLGDEMFTDTYKMEEIEDAFYMVVGKNTTVTEGNIELAGANPSAEEADEGTESSSVSGIDVVIYMRLQETGFGAKKDYLTYMKNYLKTWVTVSCFVELQEGSVDVDYWNIILFTFATSW